MSSAWIQSTASDVQSLAAKTAGKFGSIVLDVPYPFRCEIYTWGVQTLKQMWNVLNRFLFIRIVHTSSYCKLVMQNIEQGTEMNT